jgi:hypothetical protein
MLTYNPETNYYGTSALRRHLNQVLLGALEVDTGEGTKPTVNLVKQIKLYLPSTRAIITRLRETEEEIGTEDLDEIAQIQQRFYGNLWGQCQAHRVSSHALREEAKESDT